MKSLVHMPHGRRYIVDRLHIWLSTICIILISIIIYIFIWIRRMAQDVYEYTTHNTISKKKITKLKKRILKKKKK
jgi:hypothetical protein